jgi:hypothetical protein
VRDDEGIASPPLVSRTWLFTQDPTLLPQRCPACCFVVGERRGCAFSRCVIAGAEYERIPQPRTLGLDCIDCGAPPGAIHHDGCVQEVCPAHGGLLSLCGCAFEFLGWRFGWVKQARKKT